MSNKIMIVSKKKNQRMMKSLLLSFTGMKLGLASWLPDCFVLFFFLFVHLLCPWKRDGRWWRHQKRAGSRWGPYLSSCGKRKFCSSVKVDARHVLTAARPAFNDTATIRCVGRRGGWKDWVREVRFIWRKMVVKPRWWSETRWKSRIKIKSN